MKDNNILWFVKCIIGFGKIDDGSICWFSKNFWNIHDYYKSKGGDGIPSHFYTYSCSKCKNKFLKFLLLLSSSSILFAIHLNDLSCKNKK